MGKVVLLSRKPLINMDVSAADVKKYLERKQANMAKAVSATASDFRSKAPGWVSKEVRNVYGVDTKELTTAKGKPHADGSIKIGSVRITNFSINYNGRVLTPTHFKMKPKARPKKTPYVVSAEIVKGSRKELSSNAFLAPAKKKVDGSTNIAELPFVREGDSRYPIRSIKTVSVPQMITGERVADTLSGIINENMEKRLKYHIKRFGKR